MTRGLTSRSSSYPRPSSSMVPGLKFSITTSPTRTSALRSSLPRGCLRLSVTDFLLRLIEKKYAADPSGAAGGTHARLLDLDDLRAVVAEDLRGQGAGHDAGEIEDAHTVERAGHEAPPRDSGSGGLCPTRRAADKA